MKKTWKPVTAGWLDIILGSCVGILMISFFIRSILMGDKWEPSVILISGTLLAIPCLACAGGVFALRRRLWGLALAGSIAVLLGAGSIVIVAISLWIFVSAWSVNGMAALLIAATALLFLGLTLAIMPIVLTAKSKKEFE